MCHSRQVDRSLKNKTCSDNDLEMIHSLNLPGRVVQSVTCLTADPGVESSIPAWSHTFM